MSETNHCPSCDLALRRNARFCGGCGFRIDGDEPTAGAPRRGRVGAQARARRKIAQPSSRGATQRIVLGIASVYVGVLVLLLVFPWPSGEDVEPAAGFLLEGMFACAMLLIGFVAAAVLGKGALKEALGAPTEPRFLGIGAGAGAAVLAVNVVLLGLLSLLLDQPFWRGFSVQEAWPLVVLGTAVLPAVVEEWLCRGVLWSGLQCITSERGTLILSSLLFAMLHGLGEGRIMELPTRFLAGLVFGVLRSKSGSLQPGMVAHFFNNLIACFLA